MVAAIAGGVPGRQIAVRSLSTSGQTCIDAAALLGPIDPIRRREPNMSMRYEHKPAYGNDAPWTNVVWTIIGILCACGLVALPFLR